ncbi:MAG: acyl-CoA synthetase [Gammaproteobacteria bacterium]|nr:acyl-CoA synthetase [Gammaproteobacteria bacterium]
MATVALFTHPSPTSILAWRGGRPVTALEFLQDVHGLARRLSRATHWLNACEDRYRFAVALAAGIVAGKTALLPSTRTPQTIRDLLELAPDAACVTDDPRCPIELPKVLQRDEDRDRSTEWRVPQIDAARTFAIVFTSGSTGAPTPHPKTWGRVTNCVRAGADLLGIADGRSHALVGTVPPQHMYGFESTVLVALHSGNALVAERPFYPADVVAALERCPRPRALISTPVHLRALLAADVGAPALDRVVCATAPLDPALAQRIEARFGCALDEIYGSTETGQIAIRRTATTERFTLLPGVSLSIEADRAFADGGHLERRTPLYDVIESLPDGEFRLHGRTQDLVEIAGKRSSFAYLNHQLNSIPGVIDGAFFEPAHGAHAETGISRLAAAVVAPTLDPTTLLERLRDRIDPAFLPRPLLFVDRLPRNATGKLPRAALTTLVANER